jgi:hypothetical protein
MKDNRLIRRPARVAVLALLVATAVAVTGFTAAPHVSSTQAYLACAVCI